MHLAWLAALALGAGLPAPAEPPPAEVQAASEAPTVSVEDELGAAPGFLASGYLVSGGSVLERFASLSVWGRYRAAPGGRFADHLFVEGEVAPQLSVASGALSGLALVARGGLAFSTWAIAVGLHADVVNAPAGLQLLPSLTAVWHPGWWGLSLGVLDRGLGTVAHLSLDLGELSVGFAAPYGGELTWRPRLGGALALELHAFGAGLLGVFQVGASVGLAWRPVPEARAPAE